MTQPVSLEEYGEVADRRIRELADQPMDLSGLETAPHIAGTLHSATPGDSISSIMGSSDPGAIGAFMHANDLNGTSIRAGESYLVPERDSFTAPGARALGQQGLNADNALATQQVRNRLGRSMAAIGNTVSGFDPLKGLLATTPSAAHLPAPLSKEGHPTVLAGLSAGAEHIGRFLEGQKGFVGGVGKLGARLLPIDDLHNFDRVTKGLGRASAITSIAGEALGAADDYFNKGMPLKVVVPGAVLHGGATAAGGLLGGALLSWAGPPGMAAGGIIGSWLADKYLPSREQFGRALPKAMEEYGRQPYSVGGF